jgi:hypothetical protein
MTELEITKRTLHYCIRILLAAVVILVIAVVTMMYDRARAAEALPAYPPAVCVTIAGKPEPCENRVPNAIPLKYGPALALEGTTCAKKDAKRLTDLEPCTVQGTPRTDDPGANFMNWLYMFPVVVIRHDEGGIIRLYVERYKLLKDRFFIIDGDCNSACTLVLTKAPDLICATPRARFNFHAAYSIETGAYASVATKYLMDAYPERVRAWINANGGLRTKEWLTVKATMFVNKCNMKEGA